MKKGLKDFKHKILVAFESKPTLVCYIFTRIYHVLPHFLNNYNYSTISLVFKKEICLNLFVELKSNWNEFKKITGLMNLCERIFSELDKTDSKTSHRSA